ncbi:hypothetical protein [Cellulomonas soli]|nr:hypothetical protein [Cellulomonas soli]NYI58520.1 hypothetical protein [Cellulomonas soli]
MTTPESDQPATPDQSPDAAPASQIDPPTVEVPAPALEAAAVPADPAGPAADATPPAPVYGYAGAEIAPPEVAPGEEGAKALRGAVLTFWAGVAVLVLGGGSALLASDRGGVVWTGGLIFGVILLVRSFAAYKTARGAGAPALGRPGWALAAVGLVAAVGVGLAGAGQFLDAKMSEPTEAEATGSCWEVVDNSTMQQVACDSDHEFLAVGEVSDPEQCSLDATAYVELDDSFLCLADD